MAKLFFSGFTQKVTITNLVSEAYLFLAGHGKLSLYAERSLVWPIATQDQPRSQGLASYRLETLGTRLTQDGFARDERLSMNGEVKREVNADGKRQR